MFNFSVDVFIPTQPIGKLIAFAKIIVEDAMVIDGFRVFNGTKGLFVTGPSREGKDKEGNKTYFDQVIFLTGKDSPGKDKAIQMKQEIEEAILAEYNKKANNHSQNENSGKSQQTAPPNKQERKRLWS